MRSAIETALAGGAPRSAALKDASEEIARFAACSSSRVVALVVAARGAAYAHEPLLSLVERLVLLRTAPLLAEVGPEALLLLAELSVEELFPAGSVIFREGEPGDVMFLVLRGRVRVWAGEPGVGRPLVDLDPPGCLGEVAVLDGGMRTASASALTDCSLLAVEGAAIRRVGHREPALYEALLRVLAGRLRAATTRSR